MADPITFPDAVAVAVEIVGAAVAPIQVGTRVPNPRPLSFVSMVRVGGIRRNVVVDEGFITVECWGKDEATAHDLGQAARAALEAAEGTVVGSHGMVYKVSEFGGLHHNPDSESGHERYSFTSTICLRGR